MSGIYRQGASIGGCLGWTCYIPHDLLPAGMVLTMSVALRLPLLSISSGRMMGCGWKARGCGGCHTEGSRLLFTNPLRSQTVRSRSLLSNSSFSHTVLILSLSKEIELISLFSFLTMSIISPYYVSDEEAGEPGGSG